MWQTEFEPKKVGIRDFQHNFARHYVTAKARPIVVTKFGKDQLIVADSESYELKRKKPARKLITPDLKFFGMYKDRKDWKGKSTVQVARELRRVAWYGK